MINNKFELAIAMRKYFKDNPNESSVTIWRNIYNISELNNSCNFHDIANAYSMAIINCHNEDWDIAIKLVCIYDPVFWENFYQAWCNGKLNIFFNNAKIEHNIESYKILSDICILAFKMKKLNN